MSGLIEILAKLAENKDAITYQILTGRVTGFKALPVSGKRWKKNERPATVEIRYVGAYEDAMQFCQGNQSEQVALIVWVPRREFTEMLDDA